MDATSRVESIDYLIELARLEAVDLKLDLLAYLLEVARLSLSDAESNPYLGGRRERLRRTARGALGPWPGTKRH